MGSPSGRFVVVIYGGRWCPQQPCPAGDSSGPWTAEPQGEGLDQKTRGPVCHERRADGGTAFFPRPPGPSLLRGASPASSSRPGSAGQHSGGPDSVPRCQAADGSSRCREIQAEELAKFCSRVSQLLQKEDSGPDATQALRRLFLIVAATKYNRK